MNISGLILVKNNVRSIRFALESIKHHMDEIVVIDSGSTDGTLDIVKEYTDKMFYREFDNNFGKQKNFGFSKCKGDWIFVLDADECVGENFQKIFPYLQGKFRCLAMPRYQIINCSPMTYIATRPHYHDWQVRFIKNDGESFYSGNPIHHALQNYRPRLRCSMAHIFHLDFLLRDYKSRKEKVAYYEAQHPGAGYPAMYLFEDYPYKTAGVLENPSKHVLELLQNDTSLLAYKTNTISGVECKELLQFKARNFLTNLRFSAGV